ncbi:hypothetical protein HZB69_03515 [Candidatus Amesbacteria bacterium]|nr:hypothetical protein [Candidatus Amesbacteria bacterium]
MDSITQNSNEQELVKKVFELIARLGYEGQENYDKVKITESGTFRLIVYKSSTYTISFDPFNKQGLLFDKYLESVKIHMVGVAQNYRELKIELYFPGEIKYFILKTTKANKQSRLGLPWLSPESMISTPQALAVLEVLQKL